jgi:hypothetical protein
MVSACSLEHSPTKASLTLAGTLGQPGTPTPALTSAALLAPPAPAKPKEKLLCDAPSLAYLVGRPKTEIPVAADLSKRRVTCTACPGAEDHQPYRADILFDQRTGRIAAVTCG